MLKAMLMLLLLFLLLFLLLLQLYVNINYNVPRCFSSNLFFHQYPNLPAHLQAAYQALAHPHPNVVCWYNTSGYFSQSLIFFSPSISMYLHIFKLPTRLWANMPFLYLLLHNPFCLLLLLHLKFLWLNLLLKHLHLQHQSHLHQHPILCHHLQQLLNFLKLEGHLVLPGRFMI
jgi:hypothetical protein